MDRLTLASLGRAPSASRPAFDPARVAAGVAHLGPGAFFRAHQSPVYDRLLAAGEGDWGVCGVSLHSAGVRDALRPQDGLYALKRLGAAEPVQVIGGLRAVLAAAEEAPAVHARLSSPKVHTIALTVTEKGYLLGGDGRLDLDAAAADLEPGSAPRTVYGWLLAAMRARREAGAEPPLLLSCDNLPDNGPKLKRALAAFASAAGEEALADWIEAKVAAPASMVDSITPATDDALREAVAQELGLADAWPVQREPFAQWVIQAADHPRLQALARAGVVLAADLSGFERAKLRLLNGAHSTLAYLGLLAGFETVAQAAGDGRLGAFVERLMCENLRPTVPATPGLDLDAYVGDVLARFRNGAVRHALVQIAADGSKKLPVRLGAPAMEAHAAGADISRFAAPFAAWALWVERGGERLIDPAAEALRAAARAAGSDPVAFHAQAGVLPAPLLEDAAFARQLRRAYAALSAGDPLAALA